MAIRSKFYLVTELLLIEYRTDSYAIRNTISPNADTFYMYTDLDGDLICTLNDNIKYKKFIGSDGYYYYHGINSDTTKSETITDFFINNRLIKFNDETYGNIIGSLRSNQYHHDTIRIYILTGYILNSLSGLSLDIKGKVPIVTNENKESIMIDDYITILSWFMPKELLKDSIKWCTTPLYLNSKFYDRYIEISFFAPLNLTDLTNNKLFDGNNNFIDNIVNYTYKDENNKEYRGLISLSDNILLEFSTVRAENVEYITETSNDTNRLYKLKFITDAPRTFSFKHESNADYLSAHIEKKDNQILYYLTYGDTDGTNKTYEKLTPEMFQKIETGIIPLVDIPDLDIVNEGMDEFLNLYGENADNVYKWIVLNEAVVTYTYEINAGNNGGIKKYSYSEYLTNTIDYSLAKLDNKDAELNNLNNISEFWVSRYSPYYKNIPGYSCQSISFDYTAHLFNRLNNIDIVRKASVIYTGNSVNQFLQYIIDPLKVNKYKIINKINKNITNIQRAAGETTEKIIHSYFDSTNIMIKDPENGTMYSNGKMTLKLKHTGAVYILKLYTINEGNIRIPFDLSGPINYKLVFPSVNSGMIEIYPNKDSANYNLGIGSLVFYIAKDKAKQIMDVPYSERYFAITTDYPNSRDEETSIYEGDVAWI